ncbi:MAG: DUF448 domain-containing protein [Actinobacteria bacterium]|nr:DUF448 domain-containing protein [Actinomycetota bacterium]
MGVDSAALERRSAPIRTCIGCRVKSSKHDLLRVVSDGRSVLPDPAAVHPGRGAYLHWSVDCFELAVRRRAFARALRGSSGLDTSAVRDAVSAGRADQSQVSREHRMSTP